jgi:hypothetical protein
MSGNPQELAARARADAARQRLMATVEEAKERLNPSTIAHKAVDGLKTKVNRTTGDLRVKAEGAVGDLRVHAVDGVDTAKRNPGATAAIFAVLGLILLGKPIARMIRHRGRQKKAKPADLPPVPASAQVAAPVAPASTTLASQVEPTMTLPTERALLREEQLA